MALAEILDRRRTVDQATAHWGEEAFARAMLLATLRHLGQIDALIAPLLERPLAAKHRGVMKALRLGVAQLLLLGVPAHAAVHETVALVKAGKHAALAGLVNAVLKKVPGMVLPDCRHNLPGWLEQRWKAQYGKAVTDAICRVASVLPPLDLHGSSHGIALDAQMRRLPADHPPVPSLAGYHVGAFFVQDVAASYPVRLLGDVRGQRVLDIGAAPGGKTAQLCLAGAIVTALDKSPARMDRLCRNMHRLTLEPELVVADALDYAPVHPFDAVLLDAPCTATGTWRRHPEVVHITDPGDIAELAAQQRAMLAKAWAWVKPGGRLLYCVCSLEREEGEAQAEWFLAAQRDAALQPAALDLPGLHANGMLRTTPALLEAQGGMDGFFACVFTKSRGS